MGATRRKEHAKELAVTTKRISHKLVRETKKKIVAREKAEDAERKAAGEGQTRDTLSELTTRALGVLNCSLDYIYLRDNLEGDRKSSIPRLSTGLLVSMRYS